MKPICKEYDSKELEYKISSKKCKKWPTGGRKEPDRNKWPESKAPYPI